MHYAKRTVKHGPSALVTPVAHGLHGTVVLSGRGRGPRNALVDVDGLGLVVVPRGQLVALP